jgi:hypothetical protein
MIKEITYMVKEINVQLSDIDTKLLNNPYLNIKIELI